MTLVRQLVLELSALQSPTDQERGIARYVLEHASALLDEAPEALAGLMLDPDGVWPKTLDRFLGRDLLAWQSDRPPVDHNDVFAYHVTSPFEFRSLDVQWPQYARSDRALTVVTVYDLIPLLYPAQYLQATEQRSRYAARVTLISQADLILTISAATARDVVRELGADPRHVVNIGSGVPSYFRPAQDRKVPDAEVATALPLVRPGFVFYTGGDDFRKNIEGLLTAYGRLPRHLRREHQLVITCKLTAARHDHYRALAAGLGIRDDVVFTGQIPDLTLRSLYQTAHLFVFPSLYEGFGLPLAEALRCGAPAIAADSSSMREILTEPQHRFDPTDPQAMARALTRSLVDDAHREELTAYAAARRHDFLWEHVARRSLAAIDDALEVHRGRRAVGGGPTPGGGRPRIAFVTPFPPQASGVADYSAALLPELCRSADVDVFVGVADGTAHHPLPPHARLLGAGSLPFRHALQPYDGVLYCMGNSEYHVQIHELLRRLPGTVLAHDVRYAGFYAWVAARGGLAHGSFADLAHRLQPNLPETVLTKGYVTQVEQHQHGVFLTADVVRHARRFLVHSRYAAEVAVLQAPECAERVAVVPFGISRRPPAPPPAPGLRIGTFGMAHPVKRVDLVVRAFALVAAARPDARLLVVGDVEPAYREALAALAEQLGVAAGVEFTGRVDEREYLELIRSVHCAVQLRAISNGETSAAIADCLSYGVPTIVSAVGSALEYPDEVVRKLSTNAGPDELGAAVLAIAQDEALQRGLHQQAIHYARAHCFRRAAEELLAHVLADQRPSLAVAS